MSFSSSRKGGTGADGWTSKGRAASMSGVVGREAIMRGTSYEPKESRCSCVRTTSALSQIHIQWIEKKRDLPHCDKIGRGKLETLFRIRRLRRRQASFRNLEHYCPPHHRAWKAVVLTLAKFSLE